MNTEAFKKIGDWHTQTIAHGLETPLLVRETIIAAQQKGLQKICLTDHYPLPPGFTDPTVEKDCSMPGELYFGRYLNEVKAAQTEFRDQIDVHYGAEFDWLPDYVDWTKNEIKSRPYDYCIGSVHFLRNKKGVYQILDYTDEIFKQTVTEFGGIQNLVQAYYRELRAMVESGLFDGIGHLDLIKKYSPVDTPLFDEQSEWYRSEIDELLAAIKKSGMSIEINTAGWQKKCDAPYPSEWILSEAKNLGIPITIGSDGHKPEEIGRDLDRAVLLARKSGYFSIAVYKQRKRKELSI